MQAQGCFTVYDDIMDSSITRRGQLCWYKKAEVGMIAINDAFMLESAIYHLIKSHFKQESYYVDLLELFHETIYQTEMGQLIDMIAAPEDHVDLSKFNLAKYVNYRRWGRFLTHGQTPFDCGIQGEFLFALPSGFSGNAYGRDPGIVP